MEEQSLKVGFQFRKTSRVAPNSIKITSRLSKHKDQHIMTQTKVETALLHHLPTFQLSYWVRGLVGALEPSKMSIPTRLTLMEWVETLKVLQDQLLPSFRPLKRQRKQVQMWNRLLTYQMELKVIIRFSKKLLLRMRMNTSMTIWTWTARALQPTNSICRIIM